MCAAQPDSAPLAGCWALALAVFFAHLNSRPPALPCSLNHDTAALLPRISSLQRLNLDGNQVDDASLAHVAALPRLRCAACFGEGAWRHDGGVCSGVQLGLPSITSATDAATSKAPLACPRRPAGS